MGGFPKFPIPRYLNTHAWVLNKHWKRNLANIIAPLALANFVFFRMLSLNTVKKNKNLFEL